jgi:hypothetical protein
VRSSERANAISAIAGKLPPLSAPNAYVVVGHADLDVRVHAFQHDLNLAFLDRELHGIG